jgi:hypothetical protein
MGEKPNLYEYCDEHGSISILKLKDWIYESIKNYRSQGIELKDVTEILPFLKFQDSCFYVPIEGEQQSSGFRI